ncbi:hypothetical protein PSECIP111951_03781 [Pseudoalteromonas holothuriae]|uniref:Uncharacterized protein n=1 Tax=Pseudoalteromonas holothuriae TaxID=2963714 RepID=A0A9W4QQV9_9GAMM|nr:MULTISPECIES: hypothetical protein [unclassified Pseudoalteromonas]CAH9049553.1 hypothetical protein PSECIP111854_00195 [Pseudoalteromonas sp. CIP111854]CAH9067386.1 hypothetical protein PSECIP111951_03781 [Pseudoalteromonas sp. CIP111951]
MNTQVKSLSKLISYVILSGALVISGFSVAQSFPGGTAITPTDLTATPAQLPAPPPEYQLNNPISHEEFARFAWRQFIYLNSPAKKASAAQSGISPIVRGSVDPTENFVTSGNPRFYHAGKSSTDNFSNNILVWESYAHRSELFPKNAKASGDFPTLLPAYAFTNLTVPSSQARFNNLDENSQIGQNKIFFPKNGSTPSQNPADDYEILFEAKVNQTEYDYIKGLNVTPGKALASFDLPNETIEIKAAWRVLSDDLAQSGRYHTAEALYYKGENEEAEAHVATFGLIGLHIIRKMENYESFVFSTFEHVDNLKKPNGADTGLYYYTTYNQMSYQGTVSSTPHVIVNTGTNLVQLPLPQQGDITAQNGYEFINGSFTQLTPTSAGPIKVLQPPTITKAVMSVNQEVKNAMAQSGQFTNSVWQYYQLKGVQPLPANEDASVAQQANPLTQDFFLANNVIESSQPGIQLFKGGAPGPIYQTSKNAKCDQLPPVDKDNNAKKTKFFCFPNPRSGASAENIQNVPNLVVPGVSHAQQNSIVMGGCMGCHGQSKYKNADGTTSSIFSFLISTKNLESKGGFEADPFDQSGPSLSAAAQKYMATQSK